MAMTEARMKELERLLSEVPGGDWGWKFPTTGNLFDVWQYSYVPDKRYKGGFRRKRDSFVCTAGDGIIRHFIIEAHNCLPDLLAEVRQLRGERKGRKAKK